MRKVIVLLGCLSFLVLIMSCGGSGSPNSTNSQGGNSTTSLNQAVLGPLSGAMIRAYRLTDSNNPIEGPITADGNLTDLDKAGTFSLVLSGIPDDEWILVTATGGVDIDADDNGVIDTQPTMNSGVVKAIATAEDWRLGAKITPIADIIYRIIESKDNLSNITQAEMKSDLDEESANWIGDVNNDGTVNYEDVLVFNPIMDQSLSVVSWNKIINSYVTAIHSGFSTNILLDRISFIEDLKDEGYSEDSIRSNLSYSDATSSYAVEAIDLDNDGRTNIVNIKKLEGIGYSDTRIFFTEEDSSTYRMQFELNGHILVLEFIGPPNEFSIRDETTLQALVDEATPFTTIEDNGTLPSLQITIPKNLMASFYNTEINVLIDGEYYDKAALRVIDDDPLVGWDFHKDGDGGNVDSWSWLKYILPYQDEGGTLTVTEEPIVYNYGPIKFHWRTNACADGEVLLGMADALYDSKLVDNGIYNICMGHPFVPLMASNIASANAATLFSSMDGAVYPLNKGPVDSTPLYVGPSIPGYRLETLISYKKPGDDWSSGVSFSGVKGGLLGDAGYTSNMLWVRLVSDLDPEFPGLYSYGSQPLATILGDTIFTQKDNKWLYMLIDRPDDTTNNYYYKLTWHDGAWYSEYGDFPPYIAFDLDNDHSPTNGVDVGYGICTTNDFPANPKIGDVVYQTPYLSRISIIDNNTNGGCDSAGLSQSVIHARFGSTPLQDVPHRFFEVAIPLSELNPSGVITATFDGYSSFYPIY